MVLSQSFYFRKGFQKECFEFPIMYINFTATFSVFFRVCLSMQIQIKIMWKKRITTKK